MTEKISVIVLGPDATNYKGGIAQFTTRLCDELSQIVQVHHESWHRMYPPFLTNREFKDTVSKQSTGTVGSQNTLDYMNPLTWFTFISSVVKKKPGFLVVTWIHPIQAPVYIVLLGFIRMLSKTKIVLLCHNVLPHEKVPFQRLLSRMVFKLVHRVVVHAATESDLASEFVERDRIIQLYHPLFDIFTSQSRNQNTENITPPLKLLAFGTIRPYKGLQLLLAALAELRAQGVEFELTIAGEPFDDQEQILRDEIDETNLSDVVRTRLEYIPNEDIASIFEACDVAIYPYLSATQSGSLALAYAFSIPVIATRVGGLADVVDDGVSGYLANATVEGIKESIEKFLKKPIPRAAVKKHAEQNLSWHSYAIQLIAD